MGEATARFFEEVGRRSRHPLLARVVGTARFDLRDGDEVDHWVVAIDNGNLRVSKEDRQDVDAVLSVDAGVFERAAKGETNVVAAMLRGAVGISGDLRLLIQLERFLPGPPRSLGPRHLRHRRKEEPPA